MESNRMRRYLLVAVPVAYVILVHLVDSLAAHGSLWLVDWRIFRWKTDSGADLYKLFAWLVVPFVASLPDFEFGYFTFRRWKRVDWALLGGVVGIGAAVMAVLPVIPGVGDYYRGWGGYSIEQRWDNASHALLWTFSWLCGWEFVHRYFLLKRFRDLEVKWALFAALVIIPVIEALYHVIQGKPHLESLGMGVLSVVFCAWALRRRNVLLPFLGHLAIELELIVFLFFAD